MAASTVNATVTELPESRVRVEAEVPAAEVEKRVAQAARGLARNLRVPGFRAGKAPPPIVIQRVGREAVLDEAVRESIGGWYAAAIDDAPTSSRSASRTSTSRELPGEGEPLRFSIEIGVRPKAELGEYKGLEVAPPRAPTSPTRRSPSELDAAARALRQARDRRARRADAATSW